MPPAPREPRSSGAASDASDTVPIIAEAGPVSRAGLGRGSPGTAREERLSTPPTCQRCPARRTPCDHVVAQRGVSVERESTEPGPNIYRLALFRFAQDAFNRFDMAFLAAALHGFRFRLALG